MTPSGMGIGSNLAVEKKGSLLHDFCHKHSSQLGDAQVKSDPLLLQDILMSECNVWDNSRHLWP